RAGGVTGAADGSRTLPAILASRRSGQQEKASTDRAFELGGRLEARDAAAHRGRLAGARVADRARPAPRNREGAEADEGDGVAALERGAHGAEHRAQR